MTRALTQAAGLQMPRGLASASGVSLSFHPSLAIVAGRIDKLGLNIHSFKEPLQKSIKDVMIPSIRKNFDAGGRPTWSPLAPSTLAAKSGSGILIETGALRKTMGYQNIWTITRDYAIIKDLPESVWYGKVHQAGMGSKTVAVKNTGTGRIVANVAKGDGTPARPFVMFQKADERAIHSIFNHWLDKKVVMAMKVGI